MTAVLVVSDDMIIHEYVIYDVLYNTRIVYYIHKHIINNTLVRSRISSKLHQHHAYVYKVNQGILANYYPINTC